MSTNFRAWLLTYLISRALFALATFFLLVDVVACRGLFFTLNLCWSQVSSIICAVLYQRYYVVEEVDVKRPKISAVLLFSVVLSFAAAWTFAFASFLRRIDPKYIPTFFDTRTGSQYTIHCFRIGDDLARSSIFTINKRHWTSIREEVMAWTKTHWTTWVETKPPWFTANFIASVPDEFIPIEVDPLRRRTSVFKGLIGIGGEGTGGNGGGNGGGGGVLVVKAGKKSSSKVADAPHEVSVAGTQSIKYENDNVERFLEQHGPKRLNGLLIKNILKSAFLPHTKETKNEYILLVVIFLPHVLFNIF